MYSKSRNMMSRIEYSSSYERSWWRSLRKRNTKYMWWLIDSKKWEKKPQRAPQRVISRKKRGCDRTIGKTKKKTGVDFKYNRLLHVQAKWGGRVSVLHSTWQIVLSLLLLSLILHGICIYVCAHIASLLCEPKPLFCGEKKKRKREIFPSSDISPFPPF